MDLSRLTDSERRILALLAQGHTAKTIAAELGLSENAVNERLREARRKTGASSSRELARAARENRDEKIGMAGDAEATASEGQPAPPRGRISLTGWIAMTSTAIAAAALAALFLQTAPSGPPRVVAMTPANDAQVAAGQIEIRVTYDRPMRPRSWSFVMLDPATYPDCGKTPVQSADGRSFTLRCTVAAGRSYAIGFNGGRFRNFTDARGVPAEPTVLRFTTR